MEDGGGPGDVFDGEMMIGEEDVGLEDDAIPPPPLATPTLPGSTFFPSGQTAATSFSGGGGQQQSGASRPGHRAPAMGNRGLESQRLREQEPRSK